MHTIRAGFSVGGIAALETARLLGQRKATLHELILIDIICPKAGRGNASWRMFFRLAKMLRIQELIGLGVWDMRRWLRRNNL